MKGHYKSTNALSPQYGKRIHKFNSKNKYGGSGDHLEIHLGEARSLDPASKSNTSGKSLPYEDGGLSKGKSRMRY